MNDENTVASSGNCEVKILTVSFSSTVNILLAMGVGKRRGS